MARFSEKLVMGALVLILIGVLVFVGGGIYGLWDDVFASSNLPKCYVQPAFVVLHLTDVQFDAFGFASATPVEYTDFVHGNADITYPRMFLGVWSGAMKNAEKIYVKARVTRSLTQGKSVI